MNDPRLGVGSVGWTARQVGDATYSQVGSHLLQLLSASGKKTTEQSASLELFDPELPVVGPTS